MASRNGDIPENTLDEIEDLITRARSGSKQPRFSGGSDAVFGAVYRWVKKAEYFAPPYAVDTRKRDKWLRGFWLQEPHLAGVLNQAMMIDSNRAWNLVGGRNQVKRYIDILHDVEDGKGWRNLKSKQSLAYRTSDLGVIAEIGRDGKRGPMRSLYHVDPALCMMTGDRDLPLKYYPKGGKSQEWNPFDFYQFNSMPSTDEAMRGVGYCGVSRLLELAKIMLALMYHDQEQLGSRAPEGLLLLRGVTPTMWETAMNRRAEDLTGREQLYYGAVGVLASDFDEIDAKLVALSQLPTGFDRKTFTDLIMYGFALCLGYSPDEFWPVATGGLGRGGESDVQMRLATSKGVGDYIEQDQEQMRRVLPDSLFFEYEVRDQDGELLEATVEQAKVNVIKAMYEGGAGQEGLISREEARQLLVMQNLIPAEWTEEEEDVIATDAAVTQSRTYRMQIRDMEQIRAGAMRAPDDPIVRYRWPSEALHTIWDSGAEMLQPVFRSTGHPIRRATLYSSKRQEFTITDEDVEDAAFRLANRLTGEDTIIPELLQATSLEDAS